jgi:amino acid transporter
MSENHLARELGLLEATAIGLGTMIGGGIFILPSIAAAEAGPASMISFLIGGIVSLLAALSHAEVATDMQASEGGGYQYVHRALGSLAGSVVGWGMWIGLVFASAFYVVGFAQYLTFFFADLPIVGPALALAVALTALNYLGAAEAGEFQDLIVLTLLAIILGFVVTGVPNVSFEQLQPFNPEGWSGVVTATGTIYVTFIGFGVIATATAEIENPERNLPLSMIASVVIPTVLYVLVMFVSTGVLPREELAGSRVPVADVASQYFGELGGLVMVLGAVLATVSSANASILSASRVGYAMAGDRLLSDRFHGVHDRFHTPSRAVLATGVGIVVLLGIGTGIELLAEVASFMYLLTYGLVHLAVIQLRRADESYDPEFRIPNVLYPWVPVVGLLATVAIMTRMDPIVIGGGGVLIVAGVAWYVLYVRTLHPE